ncbi:hypothetical protein H9L39_19496 [Fusarium oxysporum f. sp. albedinis]|nr:hypothetical protein H9L39_19496 [Fusarium oxysporum f. sp. albedinis]
MPRTTAALRRAPKSDIRHILLLGLSQQSVDRDDATVGHAVETWRNIVCIYGLENVVDSVSEFLGTFL